MRKVGHISTGSMKTSTVYNLLREVEGLEPGVYVLTEDPCDAAEVILCLPVKMRTAISARQNMKLRYIGISSCLSYSGRSRR